MIEKELENAIFSKNSEKTFIDKLLAKSDIEEVRKIIRKKKLNREDLLEVLYLLSSSESKLLNYGEWDRYVILKYFVWIREFIKVAELLYDYKDDLKERASKDKNFKLDEQTEKYLENNERLIEHNAKFLIDLYFNIGRTSLSLGGTGFMELLKNKFEMAYTGQGMITAQQPQEKKGWLSRKAG